MICNTCNKQIDNDSKFCTFCGQKIIIQVVYTNGDLESFYKNGKWGFKDKNTRDVIIPPKYCAVGQYINDRAIVVLGKNYTAIDENGKELTPFKYDFISEFENGHAKAKRDGIWALLDINCMQLTPFIYESIGVFVEEVAKARINGKWVLIDKLGKQITDEYDEIFDFENSVAKVMQDTLFGLIDDSGKEILACKFDHIFDFKKDVAKAKVSNEYILVNRSGIIMTKKGYDEIFEFENSVAKVKQSTFFGLIDDSGKEILPCEYHGIYEFENKIAQVTKFYKHGFVNLLGQLIVPCNYNKVQILAENTIAAKSSEGWVCFNHKGEDVSEIDVCFIKFLNKKNKKYTRTTILILSILILLMTFIAYDYSTGKFGLENEIRSVFYTENMIWEDILNNKEDDISPMETYIENYPNGKHIQEVSEKLTRVRDIKENKIWKSSLKLNTIESFNKYLLMYPQGVYVSEARNNIDWIKVRYSENIKELQVFLIKYPHDKRAINKIRSIKKNWAEIKDVLNDWARLVTLSHPREFIRLTLKGSAFYRESLKLSKQKYSLYDVKFKNIVKTKTTSDEMFISAVLIKTSRVNGFAKESKVKLSAKYINHKWKLNRFR